MILMFFMFYEDIDFCKKLSNLGYLNFYITDFSAIHKHNYSVKKSKIDEYNLYKLAERKSAIYYVKKHFSRKIKLFLFFYYHIPNYYCKFSCCCRYCSSSTFSVCNSFKKMIKGSAFAIVYSICRISQSKA